MKKHFLSLCALLCSAVLFVSCEKDDNEATASLMIVNASPNGSNVDAAANGSVIVSNLAYPSNSGYKTVTAGNVNVVVKATGTNTEIINGTLATEANASYTLYVIDSAHERKGVLTADDRTAPSAGKAKVRLLHLSPNTPGIDVSINGSSSTNFSNRSFSDFSTNNTLNAFTEMNAGALNLQVKLAGTSTVLATLPVVTVEAGKIYTVIIRGFTGGTANQALGVELITHN